MPSLTTSANSGTENHSLSENALQTIATGPTGTLQYMRGKQHENLKYYLHLPEHISGHTPVLVAVHGVSCNAKEQAVEFSRIASRFGFVVIAPYFRKSHFPAYPRLGFRAGRFVSDPGGALLSVLDEVAVSTGANTSRVHMFGYSGGGQFAHRFAMKYPHRLHKLVLGAPGWLTFPDVSTNYPRGLSGAPGFDADRFLRIPTLLLVGDLDRERDPALNTSFKLDAQQGRHRVERGKRWVVAMRRAARLRAIPEADFRFGLLQDCAHLFIDCSRRGKLVSRNILFFLEKRSSEAEVDSIERRDCLVFSAGGD